MPSERTTSRSGRLSAESRGLFRHVRPNGHRSECRRSEGGKHRHIKRVTPPTDENASHAPGVVARIESPPSIPKVDLHPGREIHRIGVGRHIKVWKVSEYVPRRDVHSP